MFTPTFVNIVSFFYPIGNTPAICLTQDLPREASARILLLGCGDVRNILFTTYADEHRAFDITCCDTAVAILARNILLLTLLVDDVDGSRSGAIWNIYYHLYLDEESCQILQDQSQKLHALSTSFESWHQSKYGAFLRMCDENSLSRIRKTWSSYCIARMSKEQVKSYENQFESRLQRAKDMKEARTGKEGQVLTGFRSAAPVSLQSLGDLPRAYQEFWDTGTTDGCGGLQRGVRRPNPMFAASAKDTSLLHDGTDPLLGFHLATAYAPLAPDSPLQSEAGRTPDLRRLAEAAKVQFQAWGRAFRNRVPGNMTLRFFAGDALSFCYALQHQRGAEEDSSAHLYRDSSHSEPLILNHGDYSQTGGAPSTFNVIDTSNLLDHLGALNLLVASSPLLSDELAATLYTETLVKREKNLRAMSDELLCGHFPTISILIGLFPVEYWANATAISTVDEAMFDVVCRMMGNSKDQDGQMQCRFAWKRAPMQPTSSTGETTTRLGFNALDLANILFQVYQKMFQHENVGLLLSRFDLQSIKNSSCPCYHRGSLAAFLVLVKAKVSADWNMVMDKFLELIENDSSLVVGRNYIQELYLYLHLFDVHTVLSLKINPQIEEKPLVVGNAEKRESSSAVLCITLKVPRAKLKAFAEIPYAGLGTPLVHGILQSSRQYAGRPWQNVFSVVQLAFGRLVTSGSRHGDDLKLTIHEDEDGWMGKSPLFVTFYIPGWIASLEPQTATVAFGIQSTPQSSKTFLKHYGLEMNIYETYLGNVDNVYVTRHAPNQLGRPCVLHTPKLEKATLQPAANNVFDTLITPVVDRSSAHMTALTGRVDLKSRHAQELFRAGARTETIQTSACVITVHIGTELQYQLYFPAPVVRSRSKLRLARKSSYVEVVAPIASPTGEETLEHFMYPSFPDKHYPVNWNMPRLSLDRLPILDTNRMKDLQWLLTHASLMFSPRERTLREISTEMAGGIHTNVRLNFKETLFSMFMSFSGLQGTKVKIFGLSDSTQGGVAIIIIGSRLRLDLANHTVVLDGVVLPLTTQLIPRIRPFLETLADGKMLAINVNNEEMRLWKQTIPAYIERCRDWSHKSSCEYLTSSCIPISLETGKDFVCSCGKGRLSSSFMSEIPRWGTISQHARRIALSPSFCVPYVESICDVDDRKLRKSEFPTCDGCGEHKGKDGMALLKCSRCQKARYCSVDCQRAQWKLHKGACKSIASQTSIDRAI